MLEYCYYYLSGPCSHRGGGGGRSNMAPSRPNNLSYKVSDDHYYFSV